MVQESFPRIARLRHGSQGTNYSRLSRALIIDVPRRQVSSEVQSDLWPNIAVIWFHTIHWRLRASTKALNNQRKSSQLVFFKAVPLQYLTQTCRKVFTVLVFPCRFDCEIECHPLQRKRLKYSMKYRKWKRISSNLENSAKWVSEGNWPV